MIEITLTGNLGRDAEPRMTKSGKHVTNLSVGSTPRKKVDGDWVDGETLWFTVTVWDNLSPLLFAKGTTVLVNGDLSKNVYEKDGEQKERLEIVAQNIGIIHRAPKEAESVWPDSSSSANVINNDDLPF